MRINSRVVYLLRSRRSGVKGAYAQPLPVDLDDLRGALRPGNNRLDSGSLHQHVVLRQHGIARVNAAIGESINPKTVAKWRKRPGVLDAQMGPEPASTVLTAEQEAIAVAFRRHTLLALDDCLYALQATIPHLSRSALRRCFQRHGISRLPLNEDGQSPPKTKFKDYTIGYLHADFAEVQTEEGRQYLFVAIDRTSLRGICRAAPAR